MYTYLITVNGPITPQEAGITDAHNHVWIEEVPGAAPDSPALTDRDAIRAELEAYRIAGGGAIIDCQPGGCGRNGQVLFELSRASRVHLVASTGYHLRRYYPPDYWLFEATPEAAQAYFIAELNDHLTECAQVRAGQIKIACQASLEETPRGLMQAAAAACRETGAALQVHTEKGADAERIVAFLLDCGLGPDRIVLCHTDKRPDFGLHRELAQTGILLAYDTFYRPKYHPDQNLWPLLERMIAAGFVSQIAVATDMAEASLWSQMGQGPGLTGLFGYIIPRLESLGVGQAEIAHLVGLNISRRLARPTPPIA